MHDLIVNVVEDKLSSLLIRYVQFNGSKKNTHWRHACSITSTVVSFMECLSVLFSDVQNVYQLLGTMKSMLDHGTCTYSGKCI